MKKIISLCSVFVCMMVVSGPVLASQEPQEHVVPLDVASRIARAKVYAARLVHCNDSYEFHDELFRIYEQGCRDDLSYRQEIGLGIILALGEREGWTEQDKAYSIENIRQRGGLN